MKQTIKLSSRVFDYFKCICSEFICMLVFAFFIYATSVYSHAPANTPNDSAQGTIPIFGLVIGFSAVVLIACFGDISGAHFNPAITFAAMLGGKISPLKASVYVITQLAGATAAAGLLYAVFPNATGMAERAVFSIPTNSRQFEAIACETILTFILVFVVYMVALGVERIPYFMRINFAYEKKFPLDAQDMDMPAVVMPKGVMKGYYAGPAIGLTLGFLAMQGSQVSGGAFNPALVFGSKLVTGVWGPVWVYWLGEFLGAALATGAFFLFFSKKIFQAEKVE